MTQAKTQNPTSRYIILGRAPGQAKAKAMDLAEGLQVDRLIYATLLTQEEASYALEALQKAEPAWTWTRRACKGRACK